MESQERYKSAISLNREVQMYDEILYDSDDRVTVGTFCIESLNDLDDRIEEGEKNFEDDIYPDGPYEYSVLIRNLEDEDLEDKDEWEFVNEQDDIPERVELDYFSTAVTLIGENEEDRYMGQLTVILWEG